MRNAPETQKRLQKFWDSHRDTPGTIEKLRVSNIAYFTRWYWCITFVGALPNHRHFVVLGCNETQARLNILSKYCMARGQYRIDELGRSRGA